MIGRVASEFRVGDAHMANVKGPAGERLVDRRDRQVRGERPEPRAGGCQLVEPMDGHGSSGERVAPVVEVTDDERGEVGCLAEQAVLEQMQGLPVPFALGQAEVPVDQVERSFGAIDHGQLRSPRPSVIEAQRDLVVRPKWPPRKAEIAVSAVLPLDVELEEVRGGVEGLGQRMRLIVMPRSRHVAVDLLKTDQVGILVFDHLDNAVEAITAVTPADAFVDVVAEESHGHPSLGISGAGGKGWESGSGLASNSPAAACLADASGPWVEHVQLTYSSSRTPLPLIAGCLALPS